MDHLSPDTLLAFLDRELEAPAEAPVRRHLEACSDCQAELERLRLLSGNLQAALVIADTGEPPHWDHGGMRAPDRGGAGTGRQGGGGLPGPLRWAAGLTLFLAGAASAAWLVGVPFVDRGDAPGARVPEGPSSVLATSSGASVSVLPLAGSAEVVLQGIDRGDRLVIRVTDGSEVRVDVDGAELPSFEVSPGTVTAGLAGGGTLVTVQVPGALERATVRVGDVVVASVLRGIVTPIEAERGVLPLDRDLP